MELKQIYVSNLSPVCGVHSLCAQLLNACDNESHRTGEMDALPLINVAGRPAIDRGTGSPGNIPASMQVQH